jgi:ATP-dependent RNA helicase RhlE
VHRIGRTGRAGASGLAVTLVTRDDTRLVGDIEKLIKKKLEIEPIDSTTPGPRRAAQRATTTPDRGADAPGPRVPSAAPRRSALPTPSSTSPTNPVRGRAGPPGSAPRPSRPARLSPNIRPRRRWRRCWAAEG